MRVSRSDEGRPARAVDSASRLAAVQPDQRLPFLHLRAGLDTVYQLNNGSLDLSRQRRPAVCPNRSEAYELPHRILGMNDN